MRRIRSGAAGVFPTALMLAGCALSCATARAGGGASASSPEPPEEMVGRQVWVTVHSEDHGEPRQIVDARFPLEWAGEQIELSDCSSAGESEESDQDDAGRSDESGSSDGAEQPATPKRIVDRELYAMYKDLPAGQEREVARLRCDDSDVMVKVISRDESSAAPARKIRVRIRDKDDQIDLTLAFSSWRRLLDLLGARTGRLHLISGDKEGDRESQQRLEKGLPLLQKLPPTEILRIRQGGESVVIRTE